MATSEVKQCSSEIDSTSIEKQQYLDNGQLNGDDAKFLSSFSEEARRKVLRKIDWRLMPMLVALLLMSFLDKSNIGNAKIEGLTTSLKLTGTQYNVALSIYFIPYILMEVPSNMILGRFKRPSTYLGILAVSWGIVGVCTGLVRNFGGLCTTRFFSGFFDAGFLPGAVLLISRWYMPYESQTRVSLLFTVTALGGAVSGLLAFGIAKMDGVGGYEGWRWIFILESLVSIMLGVMCFWLLVDSPALSTRWLTSDEIRYLELRQLARQTTTSNREKASGKQTFFDVLKDWKIYLLVLGFWSNATPAYGLKFTMPTIMKSLGYTSATAQLLTIPAYVVGAMSAYGFAIVADKYRWRMPFIVVPQLAVVIAYAILLPKAAVIQENVALCYFAICLACFGIYPIGSGIMTWNIDNLAGPAKRSMGVGFLTCLGNIGGVFGSYIFVEREWPKYPSGYGSSLAFASAGVVACLALEYFLWRTNKKNEGVTEEDVRSRFTDDELDRMGDKSPLFKYTL